MSYEYIYVAKYGTRLMRILSNVDTTRFMHYHQATAWVLLLVKLHIIVYMIITMNIIKCIT